MPGATLPNIGIVLPSLGGDSGIWDDEINAGLTLIDAHDHTSGKGVRVPVSGLNINADVSLGSTWGITNANRVSFALVAPPSTNRSVFVGDGTGGTVSGELYWRTNSGSNVRVTNGAALNVSAFTGGIGGDYASVGAEVAFDNSNKRYTFESASSTGWSRLACGPIRLYEFDTTESVYVEHAAPAGLGANYTVTWPTALPGATLPLQISSAGVVTAGGSIAMESNAHVTVSGTGDLKHGDKELCLRTQDGSIAANTWTLTDTEVRAGGAGSVWNLNLPLRAGWRVKSVKTWYQRVGGTLTFDLRKIVSSTATTSSVSSTTSASGTSITSITLSSINHTVVADEPLYMYFTSGATNDKFISVVVTYDIP